MLKKVSLNFAKPVGFKCSDEKSFEIGHNLLFDAQLGTKIIIDKAKLGEYSDSFEKKQAAQSRAKLYTSLMFNKPICSALGRFVDLRNPENF